MNAIVVYESLWGNTAEVARAVAEGFVVKGRHGPLRRGEAERARAWGAELALALERPRVS